MQKSVPMPFLKVLNAGGYVYVIDGLTGREVVLQLMEYSSKQQYFRLQVG